MKKIVSLLLIFCLTAFFAVGCGEKSKMGAAAVKQFTIQIDGKTARALKDGETFYCRDGEITFSTDSDEDMADGEMTVCGAGCGDTAEEVIEKLGIKPGYAAMNYEYDPYGDGCTEIGDAVYDGTLISAEEYSVLDLAILTYYYYEDGKWLPIDLSAHQLDEYDTVLKIGFDTEGVHDLYGKKCGEVFAVECGIITNDPA